LRMAAEPDVRNAIAADALVDTASDRLYFRQFRHQLIVEDCDWCAAPAATMMR